MQVTPDSTLSLQAMNVLGGPLQCCCKQPMTGYYRDGYCRTGGGDFGVHVVCAQVGGWHRPGQGGGGLGCVFCLQQLLQSLFS
jgi:hypothetical protein